MNPNSYNPNVVFDAELDLLALSIIKTGWVQPILVNATNRIIDGFHRWRLAQENRELVRRYNRWVPVAVLTVPDWEAMMMTIRMNRAKGSHVAVRMAEIVQELIDTHGLDPQQIATGIGAPIQEVHLLYQNSIFKAKNLDKYRYSKAWYPVQGEPNG
ncbi:MAG: putative protein YbdM [bacterium]|nr:putative protein YbdM [bacterium]